jgi:hypothetical protein
VARIDGEAPCLGWQSHRDFLLPVFSSWSLDLFQSHQHHTIFIRLVSHPVTSNVTIHPNHLRPVALHTHNTLPECVARHPLLAATIPTQTPTLTPSPTSTPTVPDQVQDPSTQLPRTSHTPRAERGGRLRYRNPGQAACHPRVRRVRGCIACMSGLRWSTVV